MALVLLVACGGDDDPDLLPELEALGEHPVGFTQMSVTYDRPDGRGDRSLELLVWYPSEPAEELERPRYPYRTAVARLDAPPAAGVYPVVAFSHGHQGAPDVSTFFCEHLASHGYVVFAPTHTGNTTADGSDRMTDIYYLRASDVSRSYDHLLTADTPLRGHVGDRAVMTGHSFGGYTAYGLVGATYDVAAIESECPADTFPADVCDELDDTALGLFGGGFRDERFVALVAMASGDFRMYGAAGVAAVNVPVLQMVAEGDGHPAGSAAEDDYFVALDGADDMRIDLLGAGHNSYTDVCESLPNATALRCPDDGTVAEARALHRARERAINVYALAFVRAHLDGDRDALRFLEEDVLVEPSAEIVRK
ncbi:MAG: hypothetical protein KC586_17730 [Myxococcales bacterium]|nr:hypothetical protein [Myxococcales bacterium]